MLTFDCFVNLFNLSPKLISQIQYYGFDEDNG